MASPAERYLKQPVLIVGTGALATLFAARLSAAGYPVTMLGSWETGLHALQENGARLVDTSGVEKAYPVEATRDPADCRGARYALVLVKSWQTERVAGQLAECLAEDGLALTLQNGMGNRELLAGTLGLQRVALGVTTTGATLLGPGLARAGGEGVISMEAHSRLGPLEVALTGAGFNVQVVNDANALIWGKLVVNAAINPLTALLRVPNGELLQRPAAHLLMQVLAQETAAVATAQGIHLPFEDAVRAAEDVARKTASNHSSMFQDVRRGAPTEIDAICGAITRAGEKLGVPTPVNRVCWHLTRASLPAVQRSL
ncbi:MAG: 2-dehydropantoate 2-reductase [Anaerolineales bacterium]|nr:2-dehydropantoate 2-reductase [Anaerolineales bacterium]